MRLSEEDRAWISIDPKAEKHYSTSPYAYVLNNPLRYVDPDGMDEWEVNPQGQITWIKESDTHILYALNKSGERTGNSSTINDRSILDQLTQVRTIPTRTSPEGRVIQQGEERRAEGNSATAGDMLNAFVFLADNTNVEWGVAYANVDGEVKYGIGTYGFNNLSPGLFSEESIITATHSHPRTSNSMQEEIESMWGDRRNSIGRSYNTYVYMPNSTRLHNVNQGESSYIRHINGNHKRFINMGR